MLKIEPYGFFKTVSIGPYKLLLDPGDANDRSYYFSQTGSGYSLVLERLLHPGDNVVDIGANVGHFSATSALLVGSEGVVHAVEANPLLFKRLEVVSSAVMNSRIRVHHFAIWRTSGTVPFNVATVSGWSSLAHNDTFNTLEVVQVPAITLDELFLRESLNHVRLLKLDIEGAELDALSGGQGILDRQLVDYVLLEAEPCRLQAYGHRGEEIADLMSRRGYRAVCAIDSDRLLRIARVGETPGKFNGDYLYARSSLCNVAIESIFGSVEC
jgi:FkbM family methyltransferase